MPISRINYSLSWYSPIYKNYVRITWKFGDNTIFLPTEIITTGSCVKTKDEIWIHECNKMISMHQTEKILKHFRLKSSLSNNVNRSNSLPKETNDESLMVSFHYK